MPRWGKLRLNQIQSKAVEDGLHSTFNSWSTMHGVRAIMSRIFYHAAGNGLWEEGKRSPASKAKLGKKHQNYERQIFSLTRRPAFCLVWKSRTLWSSGPASPPPCGSPKCSA